MASLPRFAVRLPNWLYPRWWEVAYLIVGPEGWLREDLVKIIQTRATQEFDEYVAGVLAAYVNEGKMPDREIEPAILNLADDQMAGRKMVIRAGDYIMLQSHFLKQGRTRKK